MGAVRMSAQERPPPFDRLHPLGNSIVQILVDICCGDRVDGGHAHFPLRGREQLVDYDVDVFIKPSKLCNVLVAQFAGGALTPAAEAAAQNGTETAASFRGLPSTPFKAGPKDYAVIASTFQVHYNSQVVNNTPRGHAVNCLPMRKRRADRKSGGYPRRT